MGKDNGVSRAVAEDDTALLLAAVESFRNVALGRLRQGSDASRILDQEMSTRLLHLACKHDAVECARLLLDGGRGITACPVDARDQLTRTPLHVAAETHSARCIQLLLSRNARTDVRLVDGRHLIALEIALMSRRYVNCSCHPLLLLPPSQFLLGSLQFHPCNAMTLLLAAFSSGFKLNGRRTTQSRISWLVWNKWFVSSLITTLTHLTLLNASLMQNCHLFCCV